MRNKNSTITGPETVNGVPAHLVQWATREHDHASLNEVGDERPHIHFGVEDEDIAPVCTMDPSCPICENPHAIVMHYDVNAVYWCPVGHITFTGDGVTVALGGF